ncbi:MAG: response regulator [Dysgonamonadaceae bacterium]|jgi:signal transduction histidine kinase/ligand-binding sensor domain-containing protein/DNA-binding response OmpR family regulator|nr:response regulator [Dysgonamonadaceae bacterium]
MKRFNYLILFFIFFIVFPLKAERVRIFTPDDGLSNSHITKIYQDSQGYIWVATENGLNKFNGCNYITYSEQKNDSTSLKGNYVYEILEDRHGIFWVGTMKGLFQYDRNTDSFHPFLIRGENPYYLDRVIWILEDKKGNIWLSNPGNGIICLDAKTLKPTFYNAANSDIKDVNIDNAYEDALGNLWLGTYSNGIYVFDTETKAVSHYMYDPLVSTGLRNNRILSVCEDTFGRVLVGTMGGGVSVFDRPNRTFKTVMQGNSQTENQIYAMCVEKNGNIWLGTDGSGIRRYDANGKRLPDLDLASNLSNLGQSKIHQIFEDKQGNMWIVLYQQGILFVPTLGKTFKNYGYNPFDPVHSIGTSCVISILEDSNGDLWIGTDGDGLFRVTHSDQKITHFTHENNPGIPGNVITALFEDRNKNIWIGTYVNGMFRYNRKTGLFDSHHISDGSSNNLSYNYITCFLQDADGVLWIGMNGGGINRFDIEKAIFKQYKYVAGYMDTQLFSNWVYDLLMDDDKNIWIATSNGLSLFNPQTETFFDLSWHGEAMNENLIYCLNKDYQGNIWIGSFFGLYCINPKTKIIKHLTTTDGLPDNMINGIEEDENHCLWLSTGKGLCRYDVATGSMLNYYVEDGIQSNEFRRGSFFKGRDGRMYFGGINGLTSFLPSQLLYKNTLLRLAFLDLFIYNEPVKVGKSKILEKVLDESESVRLHHNQRDFTFTFAALEYRIPQRVIYYTQMENFDMQWRLVNYPNRSVTYTNLNPGKYVFKVKATLDGENFLQREIQVIIDPPFWLSVWAKLIYALLLVALAYSIYIYLTNRMKQNQIIREKEQQKEISESKLQFFTDISHEIRTPLTLIIGPIEKLLDESAYPHVLPTYRIIHKNAIRILRLINQLMDLRAVEKGKLRLKVEKSSLEEFTRTIMESFYDLAKTKNIKFDLIVEDKLPFIYFDKDCLDKIIFNLLSNAFKFTPIGGNIMVYLGTNGDTIEIRIEDTGVGIEKEKQAFIFDRFYQVRNAKANTKMGTGIGLHLSKMMIELHKGAIRVESEPEHGSKFIVTLPLDEKIYNPEDFGSENVVEPVVMLQPSIPALPAARTKDEKQRKENDNRIKRSLTHSVLIVEDDVDILNYIKMEFSEKYIIYTACNGKEGLNQALKFLPDIVVSDIVMPEMDGLALCRILKVNDKTCHIPVILLTAKTSMEQRIEGLEMGADSYIPKPFNLKHLETRIDKLIHLRTTLMLKFSGEDKNKADMLKVITSDERLFQKFNEKLKEQISNPDLSVESISNDLGLSRVHLNRRLKSIINESPSTYIRSYRLKQAAHLLSGKKMSIAEVAYAVGFSSHAYFSNLFKEQYGMSPTEYMELNASPNA